MFKIIIKKESGFEGIFQDSAIASWETIWKAKMWNEIVVQSNVTRKTDQARRYHTYRRLKIFCNETFGHFGIKWFSFPHQLSIWKLILLINYIEKTDLVDLQLCSPMTRILSKTHESSALLLFRAWLGGSCVHTKIECMIKCTTSQTDKFANSEQSLAVPH